MSGLVVLGLIGPRLVVPGLVAGLVMPGLVVPCSPALLLTYPLLDVLGSVLPAQGDLRVVTATTQTCSCQTLHCKVGPVGRLWRHDEVVFLLYDPL